MFERIKKWVKENPKAALSLALSLAGGMGVAIPTWIWPLLTGMQVAAGQ